MPRLKLGVVIEAGFRKLMSNGWKNTGAEVEA
jgi:hypothetical protein